MGKPKENNADKHNPRRREPEGRIPEQKIHILEEQLEVGKKTVPGKTIRVSKRVREEDVEVNVPLTREEIHVERIPVNEYVDNAPPAVRHEGETTIVPVLKEVVEKRLVLVEEIHITRRRHEAKHSQQVTLKKEEVQIDERHPDHSANK